MRLSWIPLCVAVVLVAFWMHSRTTAAPDAAQRKADIGQPAPDFTLRDVYGKQFTLSEFKGKIVVLEWVNPDCPVSRGRHESQLMQKTYAKYADKDVIWLGIDSTHYAKPETLRVYRAQKYLAFPILMDPEGKVGRLYDAKTTPHMYVIDRQGRLVYAGAIDNDPRGNKKDDERINYVAAAVEDLLADRAVATGRTDPYGCSVKYAP